MTRRITEKRAADRPAAAVADRRRNPLEIAAGPPRHRIARWRTLCLSLVYLVFAAHILHWKLSGKTLAPLELNEVMYTLELGIITAGFLFMCLLFLGTLVFGRFFCSWACHIMVLQDLCGWLLKKLGIRRKPIRSRLLLWVPPFTAFYMFAWPQIVRAWRVRAFPQFHLRTDAEGWASFATNNFWRNLPSPPIIALTFLVCGFIIVYLLGSRTFCAYVCPYGAIFGLADRFAAGRIRAVDQCRQCATCTAACTCGIRVHEEIRLHQMVVNPACLKDLDCVAACPHGVLRYKFGRPSLLKSLQGGGRFGSLPFDFSLGEELLMGLVFLVVLLSFRGLYSRIPFLLSLALGAIVGYLVVLTIRLVSKREVMLGIITLRDLQGLTIAGRLYCGFMALLTAFIAHSGFVRYHEYNGLRQAMAFEQIADPVKRDALAASARAHLQVTRRWGLLDNVRVDLALLDVASHLRRYDEVDVCATAILRRHPENSAVRLRLAEAKLAQRDVGAAEQEFRTLLAREGSPGEASTEVLAAAHRGAAAVQIERGEFQNAVQELEAAIRLEPNGAAAFAELGSTLADLGRFDDAVTNLRTALRLDPASGVAAYNLGTILIRLNRFQEAVPCLERAIAAFPDDADIQNNLGLSLLRIGQLERGREHLERAVGLDPTLATAHFNLGVVLEALRQSERADLEYRRAASLDARFASAHGQ